MRSSLSPDPPNDFARKGDIVIALEPFEASDAVALRAELADELNRRYRGDSEPGAKPTSSDSPVFLIARDQSGRALGCGGLRALGAAEAEIKRMFVRPEARGLGLGRRLLDALEEHAHLRGWRCLRLETGEAQPEAIALYRRAGYVPIPCFGAYAHTPRSRCFERHLPPRDGDSGH